MYVMFHPFPIPLYRLSMLVCWHRLVTGADIRITYTICYINRCIIHITSVRKCKCGVIHACALLLYNYEIGVCKTCIGAN